MAISAKERSLPELFSDATRESSALVLKEIELARLEIAENIASLKAGAIQVLVALPLVFGGFLVILASAVFALDLWLARPWLSALIVGLSVVLMGVAAVLAGRARLSKEDIVPQRSLDSLRDDKEMIEEHVGS